MTINIDRIILERLSRGQKRAFFFLLDILLVPLSLYVAFSLRHGRVFPFAEISQSAWLFPTVVVFGAAMIWLMKLPKIKLLAFDILAMRRFAIVAVALVATAAFTSYALGYVAPRSIPLIFGAVFLLAVTVTRIALLALLEFMSAAQTDRMPVAIYGAGAAGIQLLSFLRKTHEFNPVVFVDDNPSLKGLIISGLEVHAASVLKEVVKAKSIARIFLAMPSAPLDEQNRIANELKPLGVDIQVMPPYAEMLDAKPESGALQTVSPDELLGRAKVDLNVAEIQAAYAGKTLMVTGAGGSIGAELCRQIVRLGPKRLVLFEQSEYALYAIEQELSDTAKERGFELVARLGSVCDRTRVASVLETLDVEIVLHAAAYKHVPLVEDNEVEGARNNVVGTHRLAEACAQAGIERFILVSTDKAVRPTNVMGATKRMAELVIQDMQTRSETTKFSMVRFGNVLGSSGSVLPLFQKQIRAGGPVTVTHPEVTRFFMTIPEAARLVLLAGAFAEGGDVFVLDMGRPLKILDVARRMIEMSGHTVREDDGDAGIEIKITGLRPGEKLYEELLIDDKSLVGTPHPKILRASETMLSEIEVAGMIREILDAVQRNDNTAVRDAILRRVDGYSRPKPAPVTLPGE